MGSLYLRLFLQLKEDHGMMRRTQLFQELLFVMKNLPSPYTAKNRREHYWFGVYSRVRFPVAHLVRTARSKDKSKQ